MKLVFVTEARFIKDSEGNVFGNAAFGKDLWDRYLNVFTEVNVVARVLIVDRYTGDLKRIPLSNKVNLIQLPYFIGLKQYISNKRQLAKRINQIAYEFKNASFICRIPGTIGNLVISKLRKIHKPYAVEVVGDPWDVFSPGSVKHLFRPLIRYKSTIELKRNVKNANAVLYVTKNTLQKRYPAHKAEFVTYASNVKLQSTDLSIKPKLFTEKDTYQIISIGSLDQMYKSPDIVLKAIKQLNDEGIRCKLTWLGGGVYLKSILSLSKELGIGHLVDFKGDVSRYEVKSFLYKSDLFVLASKTEGLPRVIIEAMAAGLPCIGTRVGGIPELLGDEVLIPKDDIDKLVLKIKTLLVNEDFYNSQSSRNLKESENYSETILDQRRSQFYKFIADNL